MSRWKIAVLLPVVALGIVLSIRHWQYQSFEEAHTSILNLTATDISYLAIYRGRYLDGNPIKVTDREEINTFLKGFRDSERYSPNHKLASRHITVRIVAQEIALILSQSERCEKTVSGRIGEFRSDKAYRHYGWFLSKGLYAWHQHQHDNVQNTKFDDSYAIRQWLLLADSSRPVVSR